MTGARPGQACQNFLNMNDRVPELRSILEKAFPNHGRVVDVTRVRGGAKKDVRRARWRDGFTAVAYAWDPAWNYLWTRHDQRMERHVTEGASVYVRIHDHLHSLGIRTPDLYLVDVSRSEYPFDLVVVECLDGGTLEGLLNADPGAARRVLPGLRRMLDAMHADQRLAPSMSGSLESDPACGACEDIMLARARLDLEHAASALPMVAQQHGPLMRLLDHLRTAVKPRAACGLIHGELGPDHVLMDGHGEPVLIDFDGAHYFDIELEHAFLDFRFGSHYGQLQEAGLDPGRLDFYRLCLDISYSSGPLTLLEAGHPAREFIQEIITARVGSMLATLRRADKANA